MPLTTEQELRRELVLFSLSKCPDFGAALSLAAQMEQFILHGRRSDSGAVSDPAAADKATVTSTAPGEVAFGDGPGPALDASDMPAEGGLEAVQKRRWTAQDDDVLMQRWHSTEPLETIALEMERTIPSLYCRARALGLGKRDAGPKKSSDQPAPSAEPRDAVAYEPAQTVSPATGPRSDTPRRTNGSKRSDGFKTVVDGHAPPPFERPSHIEVGDESIEQVIHFLRSRDYSITRVDDGRFKLDGRRILSEDELREKAHQVRQMLGQGPVHHAHTAAV